MPSSVGKGMTDVLFRDATLATNSSSIVGHDALQGPATRDAREGRCPPTGGVFVYGKQANHESKRVAANRRFASPRQEHRPGNRLPGDRGGAGDGGQATVWRGVGHHRADHPRKRRHRRHLQRRGARSGRDDRPHRRSDRQAGHHPEDPRSRTRLADRRVSRNRSARWSRA